MAGLQKNQQDEALEKALKLKEPTIYLYVKGISLQRAEAWLFPIIGVIKSWIKLKRLGKTIFPF